MTGCKIKNIFRKTLITTLVFLCSVILAIPVLAGQGDGSGGGKNEFLALVSSNPLDGQKDVALPVKIKMTFSKNVVYMTVRDNNSKCFTMYSQNGKQVPIEVLMADDQIEFDKRRDIEVKPLQELKTGTRYTVKVAPQLESKSGVKLGKETTLSFTTEGVLATEENLPAFTSKDTVTKSTTGDSYEPKAPDSELARNEKPGKNPEQVAESKAKDSEKNATKLTGSITSSKEISNRGIIGIVAAIIIALALVYVIYRKNGKQ
ncbi:Uncharacterized [Syntrophomonas zehnderi OL-4]|uniref:Uncharacterized n=1 Tax=Syntrophomonas zehnderi OL-4 TaxID=690567 RepID=A0A0E3W313_9FIRM|nr:Uncharacterized [Syntrophomonas zehnderi OL-4]